MVSLPKPSVLALLLLYAAVAPVLLVGQTPGPVGQAPAVTTPAASAALKKMTDQAQNDPNFDPEAAYDQLMNLGMSTDDLAAAQAKLRDLHDRTAAQQKENSNPSGNYD